jgi:magnesium transporter
VNSLVKLMLPDVMELLREGTSADVAEAFAKFHAADIAEVIAELDDALGSKLLLGLQGDLQIETFEQLDHADQVRLARHAGPEAMAHIVAKMSPDDRADFVGALPPTMTSGVIKRLPISERKVQDLLAEHGEETAGGIMTSEYVALRPDMTVQEAIDHVRKVAAERETIYALYVLDDQKLIGVVTMRQLILEDPASAIRDIMIEDPIAMAPHLDQETVVEQLGHYDFVAMPIVDPQGEMLGIVTHDDVLDVAVEEATEDAQMMGGVQPLEDTYLATRLLTLVRKRATWLTVLFVAGLAAGSVLRHFEHTLERTVALIFFLPLIIASGGNSGSQSATLVTRGLATGDVRLHDWAVIVRRELASGLMLGSLLGVLGFVVSALWGIPDWKHVAITVWITLVAIVTCGSLLGSLMPIGLKRIGLDPAITSAPLVAGLVDIIGIWIYVQVADAVMP